MTDKIFYILKEKKTYTLNEFRCIIFEVEIGEWNQLKENIFI